MQDKYEAETTRLAEAMRANLEKIEDLVSLLTSCAADVDVRSASDPPDSLDSDFDALLSTDPARQLVRVRSFSSNTLMHLASHAARRLERAVADEHAELAANLASACPARDVRAFRVVRIRDARATRREATRTGMLNVWEADNDALRSALTPGRRFLISSVVPGRNGDWTPLVPGVEKDVYLHTRRDTRWKAVGARE